MDYVQNTPPGAPSLDSPSNAATNQSLTPQLKTTATDPNSDTIQYKIVFCTNSAMTIGCQTFDQTQVSTGWSASSYSSGTQGVYTIQSALSLSTTYYWDSYAIDPLGSNTWSATQGSPYSFSTMSLPTMPTYLQTMDATNPTGVTNQTPYFSAICNDPDAGDILNKYEVQVSTSNNFSSPLWDSGGSGTTMTNCTAGARSANITYGGSNLALDGSAYYWRIRFWDAEGNTGGWSTELALFEMAKYQGAQPNEGNPSSCSLSLGPQFSYLTLSWTGNSSAATQFRIEKNTDSGGFNFLTDVGVVTTSYQDSAVTGGHTYQYRVRAEGSVITDWCTTTTATLSRGILQIH